MENAQLAEIRSDIAMAKHEVMMEMFRRERKTIVFVGVLMNFMLIFAFVMGLPWR